VTSADYTSSTNGFLAGVGVTWHFGQRFASGVATGSAEQALQAATPPAAAVTKEVIVAPTQALTPAQIQEFRADLEKIVKVKKVDEGLMISIEGDASFKSGSSELTTESRENLQKTAAVLAKKPNLKLKIEGHSDSSGKKISNQTLSNERANSVKEVFVGAGLKAEDITATGMGDTKPIADNKTRTGRAANRRVEIYINE